ncbi:MAG: hypothetical protein V7631_2946 [Massilia sp.]|jgi:hypothetical protein
MLDTSIALPHGLPHRQHSRLDDRPDSATLWRPSAIALWALVFTPVFGSYLLMRNRQALGQPRRKQTGLRACPVFAAVPSSSSPSAYTIRS